MSESPSEPFVVGTNAHSNVEGLVPVLPDDDEETDDSGEGSNAGNWQAKPRKGGS